MLPASPIEDNDDDDDDEEDDADDKLSNTNGDNNFIQINPVCFRSPIRLLAGLAS